MAPIRRRDGTFRKGVSGNPSGIRKDASPPVVSSQQRADDWRNWFSGLGIFGRDKRIGTRFELHTISFDALKDLYLGDDLAARAVEIIPREAWREGYDLNISTSEDDAGGGFRGMDPHELASAVQDKLDVLGVNQYLEVCGNYERAYGGAALLLGANDGEADLTKPLNLNRVRSLDWVTPLEAREIMPLYAYNDPRQPKYGQPEIYQLMSRSVLPSYSGNYFATTMLIHESRLVIFPGIRVSRYQVTASRGGWGESVLTRVNRVLRDFNLAWSSAGVLVSDFAQSVIKISGLWEALAQDGDQAFQNRLAAMEYGRSVTNAVTIDAGDSYERQQTPLTGLPDLLEKFAVRLAAACDVPLTLLFGTSPAGLNATGESDVRLFYDRVAAYQRRKIEPALRQICQIAFRTIAGKREPTKWSIKFRPLWQDSAKDKAAAMFTQAQADQIWIANGVLSPEEVAASHWGKGEYDPSITIDFEAREAQELAAAQPVSPVDLQAMGRAGGQYQPPPAPGTASAPADVPAPGPASAPDPNTAPKSTVRAEDSADRVRYDGDRTQFERYFAKAAGRPSTSRLPEDTGGSDLLARAAKAGAAAAGKSGPENDAGDPGSVGMSYRPGETQASEVHPSPDPSPLPPGPGGGDRGLELPRQASGHERVASRLADSAEQRARRGRELTAKAQSHAMAGSRKKFEVAQRAAVDEFSAAARDAALAANAAAQAGSEVARKHASRAAAALARRDGLDSGEMVYQQLVGDYPPAAIEWVRSMRWTGPEDVDLGQIDYSDMGQWRAAGEADQVQRHMDKIAEGKKKPIILVRRPDERRMFIADGHHRATAYFKMGEPARAWVADAPTDAGPWDAMHDSQRPKRRDADWKEYGEQRGDDDEVPVALRHAAGVEVAVEVRAGDIRHHAYVGPVTMPCDYGYIRGVRGADGDSLDAYVADGDGDRVFVIQQMLPRGPGEWKYFQDKIMLGFSSPSEAEKAFVEAHGGDEHYCGPLREIDAQELVAAVDAARQAGGKMVRQLSGQDPTCARADAVTIPNVLPRKYSNMARGYRRRGDGPAWVADPATWTKAEEAVDPEGAGAGKYEDPWAVVAYVYQRMGGAVKSGRKDEWSDAAREAAAEARSKSAQANRSSGQASTAKGHAAAAEKHKAAAAAMRKAGNDKMAKLHDEAAKSHLEIQKGFGGKDAPVKSDKPAAKTEKVEHGGHGEGGGKTEQKHPAGSEGAHGGDHASDGKEKKAGKHGEGPGGHGAKGEHGGGGHKPGGHEKSRFGSKLAEAAKTVGETVAGKKASEVAGQLSPVGGGEGEGGED